MGSSTCIAAMKILRKLPVKKPYEGGDDLQFTDEIADRIIDLKAEIERLSRRKETCSKQRSFASAPLAIFPQTTIDSIEREGKREVQFFCMKTAKSPRDQFLR